MAQILKLFLYKGDCLFELKKYDEASLCYHKSYGIEPKSYLVLNAIGKISLKEKKFEDALKKSKSPLISSQPSRLLICSKEILTQS